MLLSPEADVPKVREGWMHEDGDGGLAREQRQRTGKSQLMPTA